MGDRSQYSNGTSTVDIFYRESKEKKLRLQMMERNPSHKFQARLVERHTGNERSTMERRVCKLI